MEAATAATESKDQGEGDRRQSTPISPRTTPTSSTGSGGGGSTPPDGETTTATEARRRSSNVSQHPNWRLSLPPEQEQARRQSLSYTHEHPPRRPSSLILLQQPSLPKDEERDPTAPPPYRPPPIRQSSLPQDQSQDQVDPTTPPYRPPLHVMTTPISPWPITLLPGHHHLPYPFTPTGAAPTPYPSISMPTPLHLHPSQSPYPHPSPLHLQSPYPQPFPLPNNLPTPISPFPLTTPLSPFPGGFGGTLGGPTTDLQTQQSYLLHALQKEHERAERLVARYNALLTQGVEGGGSTRKAKKEAASLKARIEEAGRQEKMIVGRLGEVWCEGRERGRWEGGGRGPLVGGGDVFGGGGTGNGGRVGGGGGGGGSERRDSAARASGSVSDGRRKSAAVLSPLVAEFVPAGSAASGKRVSVGSTGKRASVGSTGKRTGGVVFADDIWGGEEGAGRKGSEDGAGRGPTSVCGGDEGGGEKVVEFDDLLWEFESEEEEGSGKDDADTTGEGSDKKKVQRQRRISMHHAPSISFKAARDKRMSLPSLKTLWPRSHTVPEADAGDEEEEDGGFF